jgi:hypothetical protein
MGRDKCNVVRTKELLYLCWSRIATHVSIIADRWHDYAHRWSCVPRFEVSAVKQTWFSLSASTQLLE